MSGSAARAGARGADMGADFANFAQMLTKITDISKFTEALNNPALIKAINSANPDEFADAFGNLDNAKLAAIGKNMEPDQFVNTFKGMDDAKLADIGKNMEPDEFVRSFKGMDDAKLAAVGKKMEPNEFVRSFKGMDDNKLANIGKYMDDGTITRIKSADPNIAKKLKPNYYQRAKNYFSEISARNLKSAENSNNAAAASAGNKPTNAKQVGDAVGDGTPETVARNSAADESQVSNAMKANNKVLENGSEASSLLKQGIKELGYPLIMSAGVLVLLCMAYDTGNPFTAVDRALDDTGKVVRGFKEVADEAAEAVKDAAKGGFDFISFVTKNSWISFACSILCAILVFALFMMGMLGSMGGNNKR